MSTVNLGIFFVGLQVTSVSLWNKEVLRLCEKGFQEYLCVIDFQ
jgi:uncharacterized membrane protein YiaA